MDAVVTGVGQDRWMQWTGGGEQVDFFLDTEFIELDRAIELISLGVVAADGREFDLILGQAPSAG